MFPSKDPHQIELESGKVTPNQSGNCSDSHSGHNRKVAIGNRREDDLNDVQVRFTHQDDHHKSSSVLQSQETSFPPSTIGDTSGEAIPDNQTNVKISNL